MASSSPYQEWDFVIPADGEELLAELRRHGVEPGQRVHLRAVPDVPPAATSQFATVDVLEFMTASAAAKRPPFRSPSGRMRSRLPDVTEDDFAAASRLVTDDAATNGTLTE